MSETIKPAAKFLSPETLEALNKTGGEVMTGARKETPPLKQRVHKMVSELKPFSYMYKEEVGDEPNRRRFGVMAQDLEKTEFGKSMVETTPEGKKINMGMAVSAMLAATADVHARLKALEEKKKNG